MTIAELARSVYQSLITWQQPILMAFLLLPVLATALAWLCKRLRAHARGARLASLTISVVVLALVVEVALLLVARAVFNADLTAAPVLLIIGPPLAAIGAVSGIHCVYPLNKLAAWRSLTDIGWFVVAVVAMFWLMSKFRGWGVIFAGSLLELVILGAFAYWLVRRLYRRAFSR
jgi:hypothetical protein